MPNTTLQLPVPAPLTTFAEDEILFRDNIRQFADDKLRPLVKEMDEKGVFDHDLIQQFFQLGLMGIEIPEQYGGGGGKFLDRKGTRLNSSHLGISYAVFCLKKKTRKPKSAIEGPQP